MTSSTEEPVSWASSEAKDERPSYANKLELMLTLVGYAVGLGNIWRFPYLAYTYGGGAFLIPYIICLLCLGLPLFILELGIGQMLRQGSIGIWQKMGLRRWQGVGRGATVCTFFVSLYYNVILAWTIYYLGRTLSAAVVGGPLPWDDAGGFVCPETLLFRNASLAPSNNIFDVDTGFFNESHRTDFWCPAHGISAMTATPPDGFTSMLVRPAHCPARAAVQFWERDALQQSSGMDDLGGMHWGMFASYTVAWVLVYFCVFLGVESSGKIVYVTAVLPYVALVAFFVRAITLPNALVGIQFFIQPDFSLLLNLEVWVRAATQIFYSLGVAFGSLIAFGSYGKKESDFAKDAATVSFINCGTSIFAGFVVFPILGFLASEMSAVNPCIQSDDLTGLASIGLSGTGLAFIAFPIAIAQMPGGFFWALLFFLMLLALGIDSQFAMVESVITVLSDAGVGRNLPRPAFAAVVCFISYLLGIIFVTRGGVYWFQLFDYYTCAVALFVVALLECVGVMWANPTFWDAFRRKVKEWTGRELDIKLAAAWKFVCPPLLLGLTAIALKTWDLMGAATSVQYPEGKGYLPPWSVYFGWFLGLLPVVVMLPFCTSGTDATAAKEFEDFARVEVAPVGGDGVAVSV